MRPINAPALCVSIGTSTLRWPPEPSAVATLRSSRSSTRMCRSPRITTGPGAGRRCPCRSISPTLPPGPFVPSSATFGRHAGPCHTADCVARRDEAINKGLGSAHWTVFELLHPAGARSVGLPLEHMAVQFVHTCCASVVRGCCAATAAARNRAQVTIAAARYIHPLPSTPCTFQGLCH